MHVAITYFHLDGLWVSHSCHSCVAAQDSCLILVLIRLWGWVWVVCLFGAFGQYFLFVVNITFFVCSWAFRCVPVFVVLSGLNNLQSLWKLEGLIEVCFFSSLDLWFVSHLSIRVVGLICNVHGTPSDIDLIMLLLANHFLTLLF